MTDPLTVLTSGEQYSIVKAIIALYQNTIGDWFFVLLALMILIPIQFKTESLEGSSITMLIMVALGAFGYFSAIQGMANFSIVAVWWLLIGFGVGLFIFKFFRRGT